MRNLLILGMDGLSHNIIERHLSCLPTFQHLLDDWDNGILFNPITPIHSAPSWLTIFSGIPPEQHGILSFVNRGSWIRRKLDKVLHRKPRYYKRKDFQFPFVWETLYNQGVDARAFHICCFFPTVNFRVGFPFSDQITLPLTMGEGLQSLYKIAEKVDHLLSRTFIQPRLLVTVFSHLDRLLHLNYRDNVFVEHLLKSTDKVLGRLLDRSKKYEVLILSDHGFTDVQESLNKGVSGYSPQKAKRLGIQGDHSRHGIFLSSAPILPKEPRISDVTPSLLQFFGVEGDG